MNLLPLLVVVAALVSLAPAAVPAAPDPEDLRSLAPKLETGLNDWLVAWRTVQPKLGLGQFKRDGTSTLTSSWGNLTTDLGKKHPGFPVFVFSPDHRWFIDVLGGLTMARRDGFVQVGFQPDSWVYLVDRKKSRIREILMSGTAGGFHDAVWLSNERFVVAGFGQAQPRQGCLGGFTWAPQIWLVNLSHNSITGYIGPDSCGGIRSEYTLQKIQEKIPNARFY